MAEGRAGAVATGRVPIVLHGALVATEDGAEIRDVLIEGERVARIGGDLRGQVKAEEVLDLTGAVILPGAIDMHVHFEEPGNTQREDFSTGTAAAAAGGITFVVEHPLSEPPTTTAARYRAKRELVGRHAFVDFCLWGGAIPGNEGEFAGMASEGAPGFKAFMVGSEPEYPRLDGEPLRAVMQEISALGSTLLIHAEDEEIVARETARLVAEGRRDLLAWPESRPPESEVVAVRRAISLGFEAGCRLHFVHLSTPASVDLAMEARRAGLIVGIETCPHYLTLDTADLVRIGTWAKCAPPLRSREDVEALWVRIAMGGIDFIASDHAPWEPSEKAARANDVWAARNGFGSLQFMTAIGLEAWTAHGRDLSDWVKVASANPARWLGLWPRKGTLAVGSDADLAVYAVTDGRPLRSADLLNRHRWTPFDGMTSRFTVTDTMVRGEWVFTNERLRDDPTGQFVPLGRQAASGEPQGAGRTSA
jgi:allantoinase